MGVKGRGDQGRLSRNRNSYVNSLHIVQDRERPAGNYQNPYDSAPNYVIDYPDLLLRIN
jgi:hypothetical protein